MSHTCFATAPKNLEALLAEEIRQLGISNARDTRGGVTFQASLAEAYRVCLWSRVANRVLLQLATFVADAAETLYAGVQSIHWPAHFTTANTFAVDLNLSSSNLTHSQFAALKAKDAIVDQFRTHTGERPSVDTEQPDIRINIYLFRNQATLYLDLSGGSLHRRGYRARAGAAPMKENLAAAILLRANWPAIAKTGGSFIDPMCGSGTLPIEAALIAGDIAPGLLQQQFGFLQWLQHDSTAWAEELRNAKARAEAGRQHIPPIRGYDQDAAAVRIAQQNVRIAGLDDRIQIVKQALQACAPLNADERGLIVVNPPYGERLGADSDLPALYSQLGDVLKARFQQWQLAVFTGNPELVRHLGLRSNRQHALYNGPIACKLVHYHVTPEASFVTAQAPRGLPAEKRSEGAAMLANRLRKNQKNLQRWLKQENVHAYRLYDADMPEYAVVVDVYEGIQRWVHVQEYQAPKSIDAEKARFRLKEAMGVIAEVLEVDESRLFFKVRKQQKGKAQYEKLGESKHFHEIEEYGCRFLVNFQDYLDTGLFLDHRPIRKLIAAQVAGKDFLNLFAYTGTASVYAARGGARSTTTVDMSNTYLEWAQRNMRLNGFAGKHHQFIQEDCLQWLTHAPRQQRYDVIFLDPPSFSTSKRMEQTFDVQRDHVDLIHQAVQRLRPDGLLIFSNNLRSFKLDTAALTDLKIEDVTRQTIPKDFERNPKIHQCYFIRTHSDANRPE
ncbi:MAG: bifunctional 23S rRNA (guanine(2069)-N(7))-methyltransferase RlmK/23S rRNA (guanine(2445)-N(2))-methyltransferase RlmL [Gammaproteobacteria bacterium]|nr:bifunctional 23S rRNA (guanine(2069)-N(7))-methyltransferase RlmK/23S rRNA (guanine(2445)-N(2))-methyltransferase RlmL [Gammaproteobacteria bacterium]